MHLHSSIVCCIAGLSVPIFFAGCGGGENLQPVQGIVTLDGVPFAGGSITFAAKEGGRVSSAETKPDGTFELTTRSGGKERNGAVVGVHRVAISAVEAATESSDQDTTEKQQLPEEYGDFLSSGLTFEVKTKEKNYAKFDLKSGP